MLRVDKKQAVLDSVATRTEKKGPKAELSNLAEQIIKQPVEKTLSAAVIIGSVQIIEALVLAAMGLVIFFYYVVDEPTSFYVAVTLGGTALANVLFNLALTHRISAYHEFLWNTGRVLAAWSLVFVGILIIAFLFKASDNMSRVWMVSWYVSGAVFLISFRLIIRTTVKRWTKGGKIKRRAVIVGGGSDAEYLINAIGRGSANDIELLGLFDDREYKRSPDSVAGCPKLGNVAGLIEFARKTQIDLVIVSVPLSAENRVLQLLSQLWVLPVDIRLSAHMSKLKFEAHTYSYVGEAAVFDMADRPISDWSLVFKWVFDKIVATFALVALSPVMIATAIAIKLDSKGPVLFKQQRHGFNNELINIYKFRSMRTDVADEAASKLVTRDDPRVTAVGKFIRRTSIDELPQLFNVLKNELSIVGPRPHALQAKAANELYNEAVDGYFARHKVKPGITGWAQINGWRGETDTVDKILHRVEHDLYYIENWSLMLDLKILFMTPISLFSKSENAY